jgi:capsular polysaccharide biosynthesis protein
MLDYILIIKKSWKTITFFIVVGVFCSSFYLTLIPIRYEATLEIPRSAISSLTLANGVDMQSSAEDSIKSWLKSDGVIKDVCFNSLLNEEGVEKNESIKFINPKDAQGALRIRARRSSPELASSCLASIREKLRQLQLTQTNLANEKSKFAIINKQNLLNRRLAEDKALLIELKRTESFGSAGYIALQDRIRGLEDRLEEISLTKKQGELALPDQVGHLYVSEKPISPIKSIVVINGFLFGLLIGLFVTFTRVIITNYGKD